MTTDVSLSADGSAFAVGNHRDGSNGHDAGSASVYECSSAAPTQDPPSVPSPTPDPPFAPTPDPLNGVSYSMVVLVSVKTFQLVSLISFRVHLTDKTCSTWEKVGCDTDMVGNDEEFFGHTVSMNSDATSIAVGGIIWDTTLPGMKPGTGFVRVYNRAGDAWMPWGMDISSGLSSDIDESGHEVSISHDGTTVAIVSTISNRSRSLLQHTANPNKASLKFFV